jgi:ABC-type dipeptide/oligopeptide/nickel transport system permease subunit
LSSGCTGFINAALGVRFLPAFLVAFFLAVVFLAGFRALFLADFLAAFFLVAIARLPVFVRTLRAAVPQNSRDKQYTTGPELQ